MSWGDILLIVVTYCLNLPGDHDKCRAERIACVKNQAAIEKHGDAVIVVDNCLANPKFYEKKK